MKLKKFDSTNCKNSRIGKATISLCSNAASAISKTATEALGLKPGDGIAIFQDIENPTDWYACKDKDGFPLREHSSGGLVFNASAVANHLFDSIQFNLKRFNFPIAKEGVKADKLIVHAIMTSAATKSE
jgi:hypothetical protein